MFTGIIECLGEIEKLERRGSNLIITVKSTIANELKIDQSLAHDGVCLTVVHVSENSHQVVAVEETLQRSTLGEITIGQRINLERAMLFGGRLDGHLVQGHVDDLGKCEKIQSRDGSYVLTFSFQPDHAHLLVNKGSITINGVSLTVIDPGEDHFSVAIIPYTWKHTMFHDLATGDVVNLEFDIMGKYFARMMSAYYKEEIHGSTGKE
ncbi:MAG: riboflavin synthase [Saprospiraceae bacterium]|nr:riboflavin synthase [Saprospiraceae bacterium]